MKNTGITKQVVLALAFAGAVLFAASYYIEDNQEEIVARITIRVVEQEKTLSNIAEITDRNGADSVVESIILDCSSSNRARFDQLLNTLNNLNSSELKESEKLLEACGRFFSARKAVMVSRMEREFEVYKSMVDLLSIVENSVSVSQYKISDWEQLVSFEKRRSEVFSEQVVIQYDIIKALQVNNSEGAESINKKLIEAKNIEEEAVVLNKQIDTLRSTLLDI